MGWLARFLRGDPFDEPPPPIAAQLAELVADKLATIDPWHLPTVVAGRALIADTVAMFPMVAVRGAERIEPVPAVLRRPDPAEPYRTTLERTVNALTRDGNAWFRIYARDAAGWPLGVKLLDGPAVTYRLAATGRQVAQVWVDGIEVDRRDLLHIPFRCDPGPVGESPLTMIYPALEQLAGVYRFARDYYTRDAAVPPYAIKHPARLTKTQARELMDDWTESRLLNRVALLSGGIELETYTPTTAADALLLDAVRELDAMIARALLIPPSLLNVLAQGSLTYSTTTDEFRRWLVACLQPGYLERITAGFSDLLPRGQQAVFDTSNLSRMDFAARIDTYATSLAAGIHTVAEVRSLEGLPVTPARVPVPIEPNVEGL